MQLCLLEEPNPKLAINVGPNTCLTLKNTMSVLLIHGLLTNKDYPFVL